MLNAVENFSRFQWLVPLTGKDSWKVAKATKKVLDEIQSKYNQKPTFILRDQGTEFEGKEFQEMTFL